MPRLRHRLLGWVALGALAGCTVGPDYHRPAPLSQLQFKEAAGWSPSHPADAIDKGAWWSMFGDTTLDQLERRVADSNQNVAQYEAAYRAAHQVVAAARASLFPTIGASASADRSKAPASTGGATTRSYSAEGEASWVPDLWGKVRRTVEGDKALAQASAADLANARLAAQATLAEDYFALRVLDEQARLLRETVDDYQKFLTLTTSQYQEGTQARSAVLTAQTQLYGAQASLIDIGVKRSAMEHAIAVLVGVTPAALSIAPASFSRDVPVAPIDVASTLLERRPDIAGAERRMASANAQIGVAVAAYYPDLTLTGSAGTGGSSLGNLLKAGSSLWSVGAELAGTIFDFGARHAQVREARATYDESVATYRQTVLSAFQGVEDELSALRVYQQEEDVLLHTESAAREAVQLDLSQYKEGTVDYTTVITAQATALAASQNVLTVLQERLQASTLLVENLGGGWSTQDLPKG
jgi:NodT family efflux transporter outer membrane factor (OMF) lipoprotein